MNTAGMSIAAPRRMHKGSTNDKSVLAQNYDGDSLQINCKWAEPMNEEQKLYAKAFKAAVDEAKKEGGLIRIIEESTPSHELLLRARNTATGKEIRLHARYFCGLAEYVARVETIGSSESKFQNRLKGSNTDQLMSQYRDLRRRLYNHIR